MLPAMAHAIFRPPAHRSWHTACVRLDLAAVLEVRLVVPLEVRHGSAPPAAALRPQRHVQLLYLRHPDSMLRQRLRLMLRLTARLVAVSLLHCKAAFCGCTPHLT